MASPSQTSEESASTDGLVSPPIKQEPTTANAASDETSFYEPGACDEPQIQIDAVEPQQQPDLDEPTTALYRTKPPMPASFYQSMKTYKKKNKSTYTHKLQTGMGISEEAANAILARASELLDSPTRLYVTSIEFVALRQTHGENLRNEFAQYFQHSFSEQDHPDACAFFSEVAQHWIYLANAMKPPKTRFRKNEQERLGTSESHVDLTSDSPTTTSFGSQSSEIRSAKRASFVSEDLAVPLPHKRTTPSPAPLDDAAPSSQTTVHPEALHSLIKIQSAPGEDDEVVVACMMDLFSTISTPSPPEVSLDRIKNYWTDYCQSIGSVALAVEEINFEFVVSSRNGMPSRNWSVFNDVSLRLAYRFWLSRGDIYEPFVLCLQQSDEVQETSDHDDEAEENPDRSSEVEEYSEHSDWETESEQEQERLQGKMEL
jgi:hypothetical protein